MAGGGEIIAVVVGMTILGTVGLVIIANAFDEIRDEEAHGDWPQIHEEMRAATKNLAGSGLHGQRPSESCARTHNNRGS